MGEINVEHCNLVREVVMSKLEREELQDELVKCESPFPHYSSLVMSNRRPHGLEHVVQQDTHSGYTGSIDKLMFADLAHQQASDGAMAMRR